MLRLFNPEIFQGNMRLKNYFEGWYFKQVTADEKVVYSFIPGISLNKKDPHSFIQIIDGITGQTWYIRYSLKSFRYSRKTFEVWIGDSFFSKNKIVLNIDEPDIRLNGEIRYSSSISFPSSFTSPGIMGWYSFVPFMECKHQVVSMDQYAEGSLKINGNFIRFDKGKSYIEKDWGTSFPAAWIWVQSNNFEKQGISFMLSVARIPWLGSFFMGFISFILFEGKTYLFATYNKSSLLLKDHNEKFIYMDLYKKNYRLSLEIERKKSAELKAPVKGMMVRMIKESVDSRIRLTLYAKDKKIFSGTGRRAGLEVTSNIFELLTANT